MLKRICKLTVMSIMFALLVACLGNEVKPVEPVIIPPAQNPTIIHFDKLSIKLDSDGRQKIADIAPFARTVQKIYVTAYCDRSQVANPDEAAVSRAIVVRDELIRHFVGASGIYVKHVTTVRNRHDVEIKFEK